MAVVDLEPSCACADRVASATAAVAATLLLLLVDPLAPQLASCGSIGTDAVPDDEVWVVMHPVLTEDESSTGAVPTGEKAVSKMWCSC